jgi:3-phytase
MRLRWKPVAIAITMAVVPLGAVSFVSDAHAATLASSGTPVSTTDSSGAATSKTFTTPGAAAAGDLLVAALSYKTPGLSDIVNTVPAGWTALPGERFDVTITTGVHLVVAVKAATGGAETATWAFASAPAGLVITVGAYSGADTTIDPATGTYPFEAYGYKVETGPATTTTHTAPAFTPTVSGSLGYAAFASRASEAWIPSPGFIERANVRAAAFSQATLQTGDSGDVLDTGAPVAYSSSEPAGTSVQVGFAGNIKPNGTVALRGTPVTTATTTGGPVTFTTPAAAQAGDLLVAALSYKTPSNTDVTNTSPAGWTKIPGELADFSNTGVHLVVAVKTATGGSEAATWTFADAPAGAVLTVGAYSGADTRIDPEESYYPFERFGYQKEVGDSSTATHTAAGFTPASPGTWGFAAFASRNSEIWTPGPGLTERSDVRASASGQAALQTADSGGSLSPDSFITYSSTEKYGTSVAVAFAGNLRPARQFGPPPPWAIKAPATVETAQLPYAAGNYSGGDISDDSAIWTDPADPGRSVVIGDDKDDLTGGIAVYDMSGKMLQFRPDGQIGNVDLREGFPLAGAAAVLVGANNRTDDTLSFWRLDTATRQLTPVQRPGIQTTDSNYGFCMYRSSLTGRYYAFVVSEFGIAQQFELTDNAGQVDAAPVRTFDVGGITEGCVADDGLGVVYFGEEDVAIWKYGAEPGDGSTRTAVDRAGGGHLVADIEGLTMAYGTGGTGYLIASSQGNSTFAVYDRSGSNAFVKSFAVVGGSTVDSVQDTDGVSVTAGNAGPGFEHGLLVVHDGDNTDGTYSNLKYVPLDSVLTVR